MATAMHLLDDLPERSHDTLSAWLAEREQPRFRAQQILEHVFERRCADPARMSNLPRKLREEMAASLLAPKIHRDDVLRSSDGTRKYRYRLHDGAIIESVWIPSGPRGTLCVSSQAGCPAGCTFCATAASGFRRNLLPSEIVSQWLDVDSDVREAGLGQVTQVVFMGMGEPLFNYDSLAIALRILTEPSGFGFSPRRITVSTVGVPRRMEQLCEEFPQVRLAVSLHSAIDETRRSIVPMNERFDVSDLRRCLEGVREGARRVTLEYVVLTDVNDGPREARAVAEFAQGTAGHVNLLPFHPFPGAAYPPTTPRRMQTFRDEIERHYSGSVTIRRSRGLDIAGACGQLALEEKKAASS